MKHPIPAMLGACVLALFATACNESSSRGAYPDRAAETQRQADTIRGDARMRKEAADREYDDKVTALAFRERQVVDKTRQELAAIDLERDRAVAPVVAKQEEIKAQALRDKERIDNETAERLKKAGEQEDPVRAEATSKKADVEQKATAEIASHSNTLDKAESSAKAKRLKVVEDESRQIAVIRQERTAAEQTLRERKIEIDNKANMQLTALGEESGERSAKVRADEAKATEKDRKITASIRDTIADDKTLSPTTKDVQVTTRNGVVVVSGTVPNDTERRTVLDKAAKVNGVVRVEDKLAVR